MPFESLTAKCFLVIVKPPVDIGLVSNRCIQNKNERDLLEREPCGRTQLNLYFLESVVYWYLFTFHQKAVVRMFYRARK